MDTYQLRMIGKVIYYGIAVAAIARGDRPLRLAAVAIIANALLSPALRWFNPVGPVYAVAVADLALLGGLIAILLRDRRWWLVAASGFFLISLLTHFAALMGAPFSRFVTDTARMFWSYAMVFAVGFGLLARELDRRKGGRETVIRALIAEQGEARTRAELDRRHLVATTAAERAEAARLVETLRQMTGARSRQRVN